MNRIVHDVGFLDYRPGSGASYEIFDIAVDGKARRTGIGRALVNKLIKVCEATGIKRIYAVTRAENFIAQEFYEEQKFRPIPLRDFYGTRTEGGDRTVDAVMYLRDLEIYP